MHFRAGLFAAAAIVLSLAACVAAAPVPTIPTLHARAGVATNNLHAPAVRPLQHQYPITPGAVRTAGSHRAQEPLALAATLTASKPARVDVGADAPVLERRTSIKERFKRIGQKIKAGFQKFGQKVKAGFQKVGHAIKTAAQKVGHFIKTTGAKIAKVGLKIWSTVTKVASKVVGFIPGIGKPIARAMGGLATAANKVSDAIHVKIGGKLGKAMNGMSKAQKIVGYIPRELADGLQEGLDAREAVEFDVRDFEDWVLYERGYDEWDDSSM